MAHIPELRPHLEATLQVLRGDGINPTDAEIVWLAMLREKCDSPTTTELPPMWGAPIEMAGDLWWPLHPLAEQWFRRAYVLIGDDGPWRTWAYLFAHTRSAPGDKSLALIQSEDSIHAALSEWRENSALHDELEADMVALLRQVDGYDDVIDDGPQKVDARQQLRRDGGVTSLCRLFPGTTPDYWMSEVSIPDQQALLTSTDSESWGKSARRTDAIRNYLTAVRIVRQAHGK